jgi:hypothetical protein
MKKLTLLTLLLGMHIHIVNSNVVLSKEVTNFSVKSKAINFNIKAKHKSLAVRNNNPGNLRPYNGKGYRKFNTLEDGYNALYRDIRIKQTNRSKYVKAYSSLEEFVHVFAPSAENNTEHYINHLCTNLNVDRNIQILTIPTDSLVKYIIQMEDHNLFNLMYH